MCSTQNLNSTIHFDSLRTFGIKLSALQTHFFVGRHDFERPLYLFIGLRSIDFGYISLTYTTGEIHYEENIRFFSTSTPKPLARTSIPPNMNFNLYWRKTTTSNVWAELEIMENSA